MLVERLVDYLNREQLFAATVVTPGSFEIRSNKWVCAEDLDYLQRALEHFGLYCWTWVAKAMSNGDLVFEFQVEDLERVPD